ncbi:uncharacterized protein N7446_012532 [Penicillium canescens]|uniref:uncharacterized protein n=1 Tax=Penicillium canescens TaxID=5083 RepID=UPI0026E02FC0|nr:uncharacterized protein N7446_012532 [Penicillium canescens]KAJ6045668.1 hypothetical protein N7446_012532 [Penicillium canescens]
MFQNFVVLFTTRPLGAAGRFHPNAARRNLMDKKFSGGLPLPSIFSHPLVSGSNPFRARNLGNPADPQSKNVPNPPQSIPTIANGYLGKSSISLELEVDDSSSDENPSNPDALASDSEGSHSASKS